MLARPSQSGTGGSLASLRSASRAWPADRKPMVISPVFVGQSTIATADSTSRRQSGEPLFGSGKSGKNYGQCTTVRLAGPGREADWQNASRS